MSLDKAPDIVQATEDLEKFNDERYHARLDIHIFSNQRVVRLYYGLKGESFSTIRHYHLDSQGNVHITEGGL